MSPPTFRDPHAPVATASPSASSPRWALASLSLSVWMPSLDTSIANAGLPTLARAFDASFQATQWIVIAYLLSITTLIVGAGRLGDLFGRRRLLLLGIATFTTASLACGIASTLGALVAARAVQGLGAAVMLSLSVAMLGDSVPKSKLGGGMGLLGTMSAIGTTLGPSLGGFVIAEWGWRWIFLVNVPVGAWTLWLARRHLPLDRRDARVDRPRFDVVGTLLLAATLAAYALAMTSGHGHFGRFNLALLATSAVGAALFVFAQHRVASPLIRPEMFRDRARRTSLATSAIVSTVVMATLVVGPFYLSRALGLSSTPVGLALSVGPLVAALAGIPAGRAVDRFASSKTILVGLGAMATGALLLCLTSTELGVIGYLAPLSLVTAGYALFQAANNTSLVSGAGPEQRGVVSGLLNLSRNLGLVTGATVMGAVFAFGSAAQDVATAEPESVATGMRFTMGAAFVLVVVAVIAVIGGGAGAWFPRIVRRGGWRLGPWRPRADEVLGSRGPRDVE